MSWLHLWGGTRMIPSQYSHCCADAAVPKPAHQAKSWTWEMVASKAKLLYVINLISEIQTQLGNCTSPLGLMCAALGDSPETSCSDMVTMVTVTVTYQPAVITGTVNSSLDSGRRVLMNSSWKKCKTCSFSANQRVLKANRNVDLLKSARGRQELLFLFHRWKRGRKRKKEAEKLGQGHT